MREYREVRRRGQGDDEESKYLGFARTLLGQLKNEMSFAGLKQGVRRKKIPTGPITRVCPDGSSETVHGYVTIEVMSVFGQDTINIIPFRHEFEPCKKVPKEQPQKYTLWWSSHLDYDTYSLQRIAMPSGRLLGDAITITTDALTTSVLASNGYIWWVDKDDAANIDTIKRLHVSDGVVTSLAVRSFGTDYDSHLSAMTVSKEGVLFLVGRTNQRLILVSHTGDLIYDVPVNNGPASPSLVNVKYSAVNNQKTAYFIHQKLSDAWMGIVEVDIATGNNVSHIHTQASPEAGYYIRDGAAIIGADGNLYAHIRRGTLSGSPQPYNSQEIIRIDQNTYAITTLADISEYYTDTYGDINLVSWQLHASVTESGLAFFCNEYTYIVLDTKTGEIVHRGSTIALLGFRTYVDKTYDNIGYIAPDAQVWYAGLTLPEKENNSVTVFLYSDEIAQGPRVASEMGDEVYAVYLDLTNMRVQRKVLMPSVRNASNNYVYQLAIDYGPETPDAARYHGRNMLYHLEVS